MRQNNIFLLICSTTKRKRCTPRYGAVSFGAVLVFVLLGLLTSVQAQPAGPAIGTPVSTNYQGLRTTRSYQPFLANSSGSNRNAKPAAVHVVPIDDELRNSYRIDPFYKKTLTSAGVVIVGSDRVSDWAFLEAAYTLDHQLRDSPSW